MSVDLPTPDEPRKAHGLARPEIGVERLDALAALRAHGVDGRARGDRLDLGACIGADVVDEVGLVEDDDRPRAAVPGGREVALDAPQVEVVVEAADQEDRVDVGGDDLLLGGLAGDLAREPAAAGEEGLDGALVVGARPRRDGHPVADGGEAVATVGQVAQPAPDPRQDLAVGRC